MRYSSSSQKLNEIKLVPTQQLKIRFYRRRGSGRALSSKIPQISNVQNKILHKLGQYRKCLSKQIQWLLLWAGEMNRKPLIESRYEFTRWSNSVIGTKNATPFFTITYVHHDWNRLALTGKGYNRVLFPWISAISEHDYISCWTLAVNKKFWKSAWSSSLM